MITSKSEAQRLLGKSNSYFSAMNKETLALILELGNGCLVKGYGMYCDNISINKDVIKEYYNTDKKRTVEVVRKALFPSISSLNKSQKVACNSWIDSLWLQKTYYSNKTYYLFDRVARILMK